MPETLMVDQTSNANSIEQSTSTALVTSAAGAASSLAGWAISSLGKRLAASDMQSTIASMPTPSIGRSTSTPPPVSDVSSGSNSVRPSSLVASHTPRGSSFALSAHKSEAMPKSRGMQLGSNRVPAAGLAEQWAEEANVIDNPWGSDDLIDINADEDDWSSFETAHPLVHQPKPISAGILNGYQTPSVIASQSSKSLLANIAGAEDNTTNQLAKVTAIPMPKEEKAAEMARRKEERKQRIAMLKEQKKSAVQ